MRRARANRHSGFTLLELLVSVSIIALLAAILLPAIMQSRAATRRTVCLSNLRQWALAVRMYADAHHGRLPYRGQGIQPTTRLNSMDDWINAIPQFAESQPYWDLVTADTRAESRRFDAFGCVRTRASTVADEPTPTEAIRSQDIFRLRHEHGALGARSTARPDHIDRVGPLQTMVFMADGIGRVCSVIPSKERLLANRTAHR